MISVPSCANELEQKLILEACYIANIDAVLIEESTATIYSYAYDKSIMLKALTEPRIVAFLDIGYSKTTLTFARFTGGERVNAELLLRDTHRNLGGKNLD